MTDQSFHDISPDEQALLTEYRKAWGRRYHRVATERDIAEEQRNELLSVLRPILQKWGELEYSGPTGLMNSAIEVVTKITKQINPTL